MFWYIIGALLIVLLVVYISYYYRYPTKITILQTSLSNFYFDMLREKQPIVVQDRLVDISGLVNVWFKQNTVELFQLAASDINNPVWIRNNYKFTVIHCKNTCEILLAPARDVPDKNGVMPETVTLVAIRLSPDQSVIIPYHMHYAIIQKENVTVTCLGIHDIMTRILP